MIERLNIIKILRIFEAYNGFYHTNYANTQPRWD